MKSTILPSRGPTPVSNNSSMASSMSFSSETTRRPRPTLFDEAERAGLGRLAGLEGSP